MRSSRVLTRIRVARPPLARSLSGTPRTSIESTAAIFRKIGVAAAAGIGAFSFYLIVENNRQSPVVDKSVLKYSELDNDHLYVIDAMYLLSATRKVTSGRSGGHRVQPRQLHLLHDSESYFYKEPFGRVCFLNELVYGALGRMIIGKEFPEVYAVETPLNDLNNKSRFSFISENVGDELENWNLEDWASLYVKGEQAGVMPERLGMAVAFDMLFGKSDSKLANLVIVSDNSQARHGACYSVDHESCSNEIASFLTSPYDGLRKICEFADKSALDISLEEQIAGPGINTNDNPHQPLKTDFRLKDKITPLLLAAIDNEIKSGAVMKIYVKFAAMSEKDITSIFDRYGTLMTQDEREQYGKDIQQRQESTRKFLSGQQLIKQAESGESRVKSPASISRKL